MLDKEEIVEFSAFVFSFPFVFEKMELIYFCKVCIYLILLYKLYSSACNRYSMYVLSGPLCCSDCTPVVTGHPFLVGSRAVPLMRGAASKITVFSWNEGLFSKSTTEG